MSPFSASTLAAAGIGFEVAGAFALARGLYRSPKGLARRIAAGGQTLAPFRVAEAENRADAEVGLGCLILGFVVQAVAFALIAQGARASSDADTAADIALLSAFVCFGIGYSAARYVRPRRTNQFLVTFACWDRNGVRHDAPLLRELVEYGRVLDNELTDDERADGEEGERRFVKRVFGVERTRER